MKYDKHLLFRWPTSKGYNEIHLLKKRPWYVRYWFILWLVGLAGLIAYKVWIGDFEF